MTPQLQVLSQYHHFIPRFILRNFAHPFEPPNTPGGGRKRGKRKWKKGCHPGDPMLYTINLAGTTGEISEAPVSHTFGLTDMYRDFARAGSQHHIEKQLANLESRTSQITNRILNEFKLGKKEVWLSRSERDDLRRFLFVMKYRNTAFHRRFYHQTAEDYSENDKEELLKYMREKGYQKPIDVWFDNIKAILELKMDPERKWMDELRKRMYPDDANWAIANMQMMYLAVCTPSGQDEEFLLTENAYGIHEGPVSYQLDPTTGESVMNSYTEFHVFAPISPKLMIVLRSVLLPVPEEDLDDGIREWRTAMYELLSQQHNDPSRAGSILADLPVTKARNSYMRVVNGRAMLAGGEDGSFRANHKFCFRFFPIPTEYVNRINCIMLEESTTISTIAFKTKNAVRRTLEYYLGTSFVTGGPCAFNFKTVLDEPNDPRLALLKKLEQVLGQLGSDTTAVYHVRKLELQEDDDFGFLGLIPAEVKAQILQESTLCEPTEAMKLYMKLGGSVLTVREDLDQAAKMSTMRIKVDVWSKGLDESIRRKIRDHVHELFYQLLARRVWFYLKDIRRMILGQNGSGGGGGSQLGNLMEGPEDIIVNACQLFRATELCRLMCLATMRHIYLTNCPEFDLACEISLDESGARRLQQIKLLAFGTQGSICDCGIPVIEEMARFQRDVIQLIGIPDGYRNPFWSEEENIEMVTRDLVQGDFSKLQGSSLPPFDLAPLEEVMFSVIYPSRAPRNRTRKWC